MADFCIGSTAEYECNHIIGLDCDGHGIYIKDEYRASEEWIKNDSGTVFLCCPMCGEKIEWLI